MGRRIGTFILAVMIAVTGLGALAPAPEVYAASGPPEVIADAAVLIDSSTGQVLYDKQKDKQKFPASTTKVMTALLACENLDFSKTVTIDGDTGFTKGARIYLLEDEQLTVEQIFTAMMTESANDAAVALAKEISGSQEAFAERMNRRAKELGAENSNFVNPNGLHDEAHVSTAYDLALIAREGMKHQEFRDAVSTYKYYIPATNKQDERYLYNANRLLYDTKRKVTVNGVSRPIKYDDAIGIKTGYTPEAGNCLIAGAKRGETELIAVVLDSGGLYQDAISLLEYGFDNYKSVPVMTAGTELGEVPVKKGKVKTVKAVADRDIIATMSMGTLDNSIAKKTEMIEDLRAPVKKGQKVGTVKIYDVNETLLGEFDAVAAADVEEGGFLSAVGISDKTASRIFRIGALVLGIPLLLAVLYVLMKRRQLRRKRLRRQQREERLRRREAEAAQFWESEFHVSYPGGAGNGAASSGARSPRPARESLLSSRPFTAEKQEERERKERSRAGESDERKEKKRRTRRGKSRGRVERSGIKDPAAELSEEEKEKLKYLHITKL